MALCSVLASGPALLGQPRHRDLIDALSEQTSRGSAARQLGSGGRDAARAMGRWLAQPRPWSDPDVRRGRRVLEILEALQRDAVPAAADVLAALPGLPNGLVCPAVNALAEVAPWWADAPEALALDERVAALRRAGSWQSLNSLLQTRSRYAVRRSLGPIRDLDRSVPAQASRSPLVCELALDRVGAGSPTGTDALDACLAVLEHPNATRRIPWQTDAAHTVMRYVSDADVLRCKAARAVLRIAPDRPELVHAYRVVVRQGPAWERPAAIRAIGHAATSNDVDSVRVLLAVLDETDAVPVRAALEALAMIGARGDDVIASLEQVRQRADPELAELAVAALRAARR